MGTPGSDGQDTKKLAAARTSFPDYPGGNFLAHAGSQYKEDIDARLSMPGLLGVAQGGDSPAVKAIIDTDLSMLPELPTTHKDYYRNLETRLKIETQPPLDPTLHVLSGKRAQGLSSHSIRIAAS